MRAASQQVVAAALMRYKTRLSTQYTYSLLEAFAHHRPAEFHNRSFIRPSAQSQLVSLCDTSACQHSE